jgi:flagellar hook assembly protein FlgD
MAVAGNENILPKKFYVSSNYPNPFNPTTSFYIDVPASGKLTVKIFDVNGRMVQELINTYVNAGRVQSQWSGKNAFGMLSPTGIYFLHVETATNYQVQKLALVK